jgi:hypothetical protein
MTRREGGRSGLGDERPERRPRAVDNVLDPVRREGGDEVGRSHEQEDVQAPKEDGCE